MESEPWTSKNEGGFAYDVQMWEWAGADSAQNFSTSCPGERCNMTLCLCEITISSFPRYCWCLSRGCLSSWQAPRGEPPLERQSSSGWCQNSIGFPENPFRFTDALSSGAICSPLRHSGWVSWQFIEDLYSSPGQACVLQTATENLSLLFVKS